MPRSGTTLVEQILASHPKAFGAGELRDFYLLTRDLSAYLQSSIPYPECAALLDQESARYLATGYLDHLLELSADATHVIDKAPNNFRHLGLIALLFPRVRLVHCRREALDVGLSCYFQYFRSQHFTNDLKHIGLYYREYERLMAHWKKVLPLPVLDVSYEDLVSDVEGVGRRMVDFCGLDWDDACLRFDKTNRTVLTASQWQVRQPIYKTSVQRWKNYEKHLGPLKRALDGGN